MLYSGFYRNFARSLRALILLSFIRMPSKLTLLNSDLEIED
ncbi:hypothetical protein HMPREF1869_01827 [Bacteroidales bacterium KA00251]|nr:hypothetical protein HMPREF1869_01827 [Bacteroidales bacterium KA00251]